MSYPLQARYYADSARQYRAGLLENVPLARDTYRLRFECPEMARRAQPGQFLMLRLAGFDDPLIGRPLALYDTVLDDAGEPCAIDVAYIVKGKLTSRLVNYRTGQKIEVWGPMGNGFLPQPAQHLIMVAGGIGQTPFPALAREVLGQRRYGDPPREASRAERVTLCYGARTADYLAGVEDFERIGVEVRLATDDGSRGHHGLVTELLEHVLDETTLTHRIVCCGPEPMMEAVAEIAAARSVPCQVSLETPMACGIGICFTCVARVRDEAGDWDYKRTCVEGPVFDAQRIVW
jgi:dihydroorotate dehydrogenase electron transfer subunit